MSSAGEPLLHRKPPAGGGVIIRPARLPGVPSPFGLLWQAQAFLLSLILSLGSVAALWCFGYAFWAILEAIAHAGGIARGESIALKVLLHTPFLAGRWSSALDGWPFDGAACLSALATAGLLYLGFDRMGALGNRRAAALLLRKSRRLLARPLPRERHFVEIRSGSRHLPIPSEVGWLFFYPDRLEFVGDEVRVALPRPAPGDVSLRRPWAGLGGAWVRMTLPDGVLLILPRDQIQRTSDSVRLAPALRDRLTGES